MSATPNKTNQTAAAIPSLGSRATIYPVEGRSVSHLGQHIPSAGLSVTITPSLYRAISNADISITAPNTKTNEA